MRSLILRSLTRGLALGAGPLVSFNGCFVPVTVSDLRSKRTELNRLIKQAETLAGRDAYGAHAANMAERNRQAVKSGQNIYPMPARKNEQRRESCRLDFALFCKTYFPEAFRLPFAPDHLKVIAKIENAVLHGALAAFAMPRGFGKSTIAKAAAIWAIVYGHRRWVCLIAATGPLSISLLRYGLKPMLRNSDLLMEDFPEVCHPFRKLENSAAKARGQHLNGVDTCIVWEKDALVFPRVPNTDCAESRVTCFGIEAALRGQSATLSTGEVIRPDLVLIDDPQTKASANSASETQNRLEIIMGDVLNLAGGDCSIAGLMACTVIRKGDLSDTILDQKQSPEWRGERTKLVYKFPTNEKFWEEYFAARENDLAAGGDGACATALYRERQAEADAGAEVAWPERYPPEFASAVEHAMYLRYRSPDLFAAEYQNEPVEQNEAEGQFLSTQQIQGKTNGYDRGLFPTACTVLTSFIDCQQDSLWWMVCAWEPEFTGYVIDYGCWPQQNRTHYSKRNLRHTLAMRYPNMGAEAAIFQGLTELTGNLFGRKFTRDDGAAMQLDKLLVDSGDFTKEIYSFTRQSVNRGSILPSKGFGITAANAPWSDIKPKPGEKHYQDCVIAPTGANRAIKLARYDTNAWKTFVQLRLATSIGDKGSLSLFKASHYDHRMIAEHLTAETPIKTAGRGRELWEWKLPANKPDNEMLDCLVGCAVGASIEKIALPELKRSSGGNRPRRTLAQMAAAAGGK